MTLLGLVQHTAEVERNWFRRVPAGERVPPIQDPDADLDGPDGGFEVADDATLAGARAIWAEEIAHARANCAGRALDGTSPFMSGRVSLRWIFNRMIAEYARHGGHADLLRERIDGATWV